MHLKYISKGTTFPTAVVELWRGRGDKVNKGHTSMQKRSAMNFTTLGGSILAPGSMPRISSSCCSGFIQRLSVFRLTPALSASCCFDIAFIIFCFLVTQKSQISQKGFTQRHGEHRDLKVTQISQIITERVHTEARRILRFEGHTDFTDYHRFYH